MNGVLLVGFGGPTPGCCEQRHPCPGEAFCFVDGVLGNAPGRRARVDEVAAHYREVGGFSPFNRLTDEQGVAIAAALRARGVDVPVRAGFRHWRPYVKDVVADLAKSGATRLVAVILAPHQSSVSWDWYIKVVGEALDPLGASAPRIEYVDPFWKEEGLIEANAARVRDAFAKLGERDASAELIFTAHAIPNAIARTSPYVRQFEETAALVAARVGRKFTTAFQSGPGDAAIPWTGPDIADVMKERAAKGKDFVVAPIGFLCDNVEILYDLDVEARREASSRGAGFERAATAGSHPAFIAMLADRIAARLSR